MEDLQAKYEALGWTRVTKLVQISVAGNATGGAQLTTDGKTRFMVTDISDASTGVYTFGISTNVHEGIPVVAATTPGAAFFGTRVNPIEFPRMMEANEIWAFTVTDTSTAVNVISFVVHGFVEKG